MIKITKLEKALHITMTVIAIATTIETIIQKLIEKEENYEN